MQPLLDTLVSPRTALAGACAPASCPSPLQDLSPGHTTTLCARVCFKVLVRVPLDLWQGSRWQGCLDTSLASKTRAQATALHKMHKERPAWFSSTGAQFVNIL